MYPAKERTKIIQEVYMKTWKKEGVSRRHSALHSSHNIRKVIKTRPTETKTLDRKERQHSMVTGGMLTICIAMASRSEGKGFPF